MESAYAATLPPRERRLGARLEGFGDIVFGFAVSQCALQLPTFHGHVDLARGAASLAAYFGTFGILAALWLTFHRIMSESFRARGLDLFLAFAYLAFVTLMPFALYSVSHQTQTLTSARAAIAEYAVLFAALLLLGATMTLRNLRRGWYLLTAEERNFSWTAFVRRLSLAGSLAVPLAIDLFVGPVQSGFTFVLMAIIPRLMAIFFNEAPEPKRLHIAPPAPIGNT